MVFTSLKSDMVHCLLLFSVAGAVVGAPVDTEDVCQRLVGYTLRNGAAA